jgi:hypothetical protein
MCVLLLDLFQDDLKCLFSPHQVNDGGVQKAPGVQVRLYKSHTTEESLSRRTSDRYSKYCLAIRTKSCSDPRKHLFFVRLCFTTSTQVLRRLTSWRCVVGRLQKTSNDTAPRSEKTPLLRLLRMARQYLEIVYRRPHLVAASVHLCCRPTPCVRQVLPGTVQPFSVDRHFFELSVENFEIK